MICKRKERSGGLFHFEQRNGQLLLLGERCAQYLNHLLGNPGDLGLLS
jgi:hypothetical protein